MIRILKRIGFVVACGLFIPFSTFTASIWLVTSLTSSIIGYLMIPFEYVFTGDTKICERLMDFFWYHFPKLYDERTKLFFNFIHPENDYYEVKTE